MQNQNSLYKIENGPTVEERGKRGEWAGCCPCQEDCLQGRQCDLVLAWVGLLLAR